MIVPKLPLIVLSLSLILTPFAYAAPDESIEKTSQANIELFTTAFNEIKNFYVDPVSDDQLFQDAIRGMLAGLDPHSAFLDREEYRELNTITTGEFAGIGLEITLDHDYVKVISPLDGSPAQDAGLKTGDYIIKINGKPMKGLSLQDAVNAMRGPPGSSVKLLVYREGDKKLRMLNLIRRDITIKSVQSKILEPGYAYIRISLFQGGTGDEVRAAIQQLEKPSGKPLKGLVLDLRNNPGGLLDSSIDVSNLFLNSKTLGNNKLIVYTQGRLKDAQIQAHANGSDQLEGSPLVILINGGSASGSEIVAGALQDYKRALLVGTKSFGKGSVQTVIPLPGDRAIKLTTALYYTPKGHVIQAQGITPDVVVEQMDFDPQKPDPSTDFLANLKEADLKGHLKEITAAVPAAQDTAMTTLLYQDFQLYEALNLLKGINRLKS